MKQNRIGCVLTAAVTGMQLVSAMPVAAVTVPGFADTGGAALGVFADQICEITQSDANKTFFDSVSFDGRTGLLTADGSEAGSSCGDLSVRGGELMIVSGAPDSNVQSAGTVRRFADAAAEYGYVTEQDGDMLTVTNEFQTARLIVKAAGKIDPHGAKASAEGYRDLHIFQYASTAQACAAYRLYQQDPAVQYVQPSHIITIDPAEIASADAAVSGLDSGAYMSWGAEQIGTEEFYNTYLKDKALPEVKVAVIDTGLNTAPKLFEGRVLEGGINFSGSGDDGFADDLNHGTHVSGTICELTPDNVKILPIKSFSKKGSASDEQIYAGIMYALENGADVLNMSFGGLGVNPLEVEAMMIAEENGIICCAAAGNNADDARYYYPSSIKSCITVAAVDENMARASFSNFGDMLDVSAPGVGIVSYGIENDTKTESKNGTSMATPHVTACCALLCSYDPEITSERAENLLCLNAVDLGEPGFDADTGWGLVCMKDFRWDAGICKAPEFSKEAGNYGNAQMIELTAEQPDTEIYYTTDGTLPGRENGTLYTEPIIVEQSVRLTAVTVRKDYIDSVPAVAVYTIGGKDIAGALTIENGIVTGYCGVRQRVTIPDTADGVPVTAVAADAFAGNQFLEKVVLPESVTVIGRGAFANCTNLTEIEAEGVTELGASAFAGDVLLETVKLDPALDQLGEKAFAGCGSLTALPLPAVKMLPASCFADCTALQKLELPAVTEFAPHALENCSALTEIVIDWRNVTLLGSAALKGCTSFAGNLTLDSLELLGDSVFEGDTALLRVSLPDSVTELPAYVFSGCSGLRLLELPGAEVFGERSAALGSSRDDFKLVLDYGKVRSLGENAFYGTRLGNGFNTVTFSALETLNPRSFGGAFAGIVELPLVKHVPENAFAGAVIYGVCLDAAETLDSSSIFGAKSVRLTAAAKTVAADAFPPETWVVTAEDIPALAACEGIRLCQEPLVMRVNTVKLEQRQYAYGVFRITALGDGLTYQWYRVSEDQTEAIEGAVSPEYAPATGTQGTFVYRCVITDAAGKQEFVDCKAVIAEPAECMMINCDKPFYASGAEVRHYLLSVPESGEYVLEATADAPMNGTLTDENGVLCGRFVMQENRDVILTATLDSEKNYYLDTAPYWACEYALFLTAALEERTLLADCSVTLQQIPFGYYDVNYHPPLKVTAPDGTELTEDTDYTVRINRVNMHDQMTLFGLGAYKGCVIVRTDVIDRVPEDTPIPVTLTSKKDYATFLFIPENTGTYYFYGANDPHYLDEWKSYSTSGRISGGKVYSGISATCTVSSKPAGKGTVYTYDSMSNRNDGQFCGSMLMNAGQMYYITLKLREDRTAKFNLVVSEQLRELRDSELDGNFYAVYQNGRIYEPETELTYEDLTLIEGQDYLVLHSANFAPGAAQITLVGTGLYIGSVSRSYEIIFPPQNTPDSFVPLGETTAVACDESRMQTVWFRADQAENSYTNVRYRVLNEQTSGTEMLYRVYRLDDQLKTLALMSAMPDAKNDYMLKNGIYCICCTRKFTDRACAANLTVVIPYALQNAEMTITDAVYTGGAVQEPVVLTMPDGTVLQPGRDYIIAYPEEEANVMFGEVPFTIRSTKYSYGGGEGMYRIVVKLPEDDPPELTVGSHAVRLTIDERLAWYQLTAEEETEFLLASDDVPDVVMRVFSPETEMLEQLFGTGTKALTFTVPAGETRYIMLKYNGLMREGTLHFRLETEQKALAACTYIASPVEWTGEHVTPDIEIADGDYTLVEGVDYVQRYIVNDVDIGTASVNYIGKGKYVGMLDVDFPIIMDRESMYDCLYSEKKDFPVKPLMLDYEYSVRNREDDRYRIYTYYSGMEADISLSVFDARVKLSVQVYDMSGTYLGYEEISREGELRKHVYASDCIVYLFSPKDISGSNQQWKMQLTDLSHPDAIIWEDEEGGVFYRIDRETRYAEAYRIAPNRQSYHLLESVMTDEIGYYAVLDAQPGVFAEIPRSSVVYAIPSLIMARYADYYRFLLLPPKYASHSGDVKGDLNMDGNVTNADIVLFANYLAENPLIDTDCISLNADMDENGVLNAADLYLLREEIMLQPTCVPCQPRVYEVWG